jgi:hypothetical protein
MKEAVRFKTMPAGSIQAGMIVQTNIRLRIKGWRVVTHIAIPPRGGVQFELNKTGEAKNSVMYDDHRWDDQVAYQVDQDGEPVIVEVEDRLKKRN